MFCTFCDKATTEVVNTRTTRSGSQVWRRRRCTMCGKVYTSYERLDLGFLTVIANDGSTKPYSRSKLFRSIILSFEPDQELIEVDNLIDSIEVKILDLGRPEVLDNELSDLVLNTIKPLDVSAFIRYLTTHQQFASNQELKKKLKKY